MTAKMRTKYVTEHHIYCIQSRCRCQAAAAAASLDDASVNQRSPTVACVLCEHRRYINIHTIGSESKIFQCSTVTTLQCVCALQFITDSGLIVQDNSNQDMQRCLSKSLRCYYVIMASSESDYSLDLACCAVT